VLQKVELLVTGGGPEVVAVDGERFFLSKVQATFRMD